MNEVSKLYENAGVEPVLFFDCESYNQKVEEGYILTPKKQIDLIHLLSIDRIVTIFYENQQIYISVCPNNPHDDRQICECGASWVETLARVINSYWLLFSEEEYKQIKNILESEVRE